MTNSTKIQLFPCGTVGCQAQLIAPGKCRKCREEIGALDRIAAVRQVERRRCSVGGLFRCVMNFVALALLVYVLFNFAKMFADWIAGGF